jgi:MoxR-like ATPase
MTTAVQLNPLLVPGQMVAMQQTVDQVEVHPKVKEYAVTLVAATREPLRYELPKLAPWIQYGASPRASVGLIVAARALAFVRKRHYVLPEDIAALLPEVLRHRLVLSYDAIADNVSPEQVIEALLKQFPAEQVEIRD